MEGNIGFLIKKRREQMNMTQCELSKASKVCRGTISQIENGKSDNVRMGTLKAIANALCTSMDSFFTETVK